MAQVVRCFSRSFVFLRRSSVSSHHPSSASASHPVGTTVRVQDFLSNIPVRRQTAHKKAAKILTDVRKLLASYAFARSEIRLTLKVLKAKNDKANWSYAPSSSTSTLLEPASKVMGSEVAAQLVSHTISSEDQSCQREADGYGLAALLINPESGTCGVP